MMIHSLLRAPIEDPLIPLVLIKDNVYFCYCAYVLRISRYWGFLWVVSSNTGTFLRGLKLCRESRTYKVFLVSKKKIWGNHAFFRDKKASQFGENSTHLLLFKNNHCLIISEKCVVRGPHFSVWISIALAKI